MRPKLTYSNVMSTLCFFLLLSGGAAYAASQLGKNSVGAKQLKKNAVTTAKIKNEAVTAAKVKKGTLTGTQINESKLGTVPIAQTASSLAPPEAWHEVGASGEPAFENSWKDISAPPFFEPARFYKDAGGVVHLGGVVEGGTSGKTIFRLPPGFRPANGKLLVLNAVCVVGCTSTSAVLFIAGTAVVPGEDGAVDPIAPGGTVIALDGVSFRAES